MYDQIKTRENYDLLKSTGMFWICHPELTGEWSKDKEVILAEEPKKVEIFEDALKSKPERPYLLSYKQPWDDREKYIMVYSESVEQAKRKALEFLNKRGKAIPLHLPDFTNCTIGLEE